MLLGAPHREAKPGIKSSSSTLPPSPAANPSICAKQPIHPSKLLLGLVLLKEQFPSGSCSKLATDCSHVASGLAVQVKHPVMKLHVGSKISCTNLFTNRCHKLLSEHTWQRTRRTQHCDPDEVASLPRSPEISSTCRTHCGSEAG